MTRNDAIRLGQVWNDTNGRRIQAHGGSMHHENGTFYRYGENKERTTPGSGVWHWGGPVLPRVTLHGTRHTWATLALLEGIPAKVVAEVLGHSSTQVTLDVYSHVDAGMQADATSRVAGLFGAR
jgi:integrase